MTDQPETTSYALADIEAVMVPYFKARVRVVTRGRDGAESVEVLECPHPYKHEHEQAARTCAKQLAKSRGLRLA